MSGGEGRGLRSHPLAQHVPEQTPSPGQQPHQRESSASKQSIVKKGLAWAAAPLAALVDRAGRSGADSRKSPKEPRQSDAGSQPSLSEMDTTHTPQDSGSIQERSKTPDAAGGWPAEEANGGGFVLGQRTGRASLASPRRPGSALVPSETGKGSRWAGGLLKDRIGALRGMVKESPTVSRPQSASAQLSPGIPSFRLGMSPEPSAAGTPAPPLALEAGTASRPASRPWSSSRQGSRRPGLFADTTPLPRDGLLFPRTTQDTAAAPWGEEPREQRLLPAPPSLFEGRAATPQPPKFGASGFRAGQQQRPMWGSLKPVPLLDKAPAQLAPAAQPSRMAKLSRPSLASTVQQPEATSQPPALTAADATATPVRTFPQLEPRGVLSGAKRGREGTPQQARRLRWKPTSQLAVAGEAAGAKRGREAEGEEAGRQVRLRLSPGEERRTQAAGSTPFPGAQPPREMTDVARRIMAALNQAAKPAEKVSAVEKPAALPPPPAGSLLDDPLKLPPPVVLPLPKASVSFSFSSAPASTAAKPAEQPRPQQSSASEPAFGATPVRMEPSPWPVPSAAAKPAATPEALPLPTPSPPPITVPAETTEGPPTFSRPAEATPAASKPSADGFQFGVGGGPEKEKLASINAKLAAVVKRPQPPATPATAPVPEFRFGTGSGAEAQKWAGVNAKLTAVVRGKPAAVAAPAGKAQSKGLFAAGGLAAPATPQEKAVAESEVAAAVALPDSGSDEEEDAAKPAAKAAEPAPAPKLAAGGWDLSFLQKNQAAASQATAAVADEIEKQKSPSPAPEASKATFSFGVPQSSASEPTPAPATFSFPASKAAPPTPGLFSFGVPQSQPESSIPAGSSPAFGVLGSGSKLSPAAKPFEPPKATASEAPAAGGFSFPGALTKQAQKPAEEAPATGFKLPASIDKEPSEARSMSVSPRSGDTPPADFANGTAAKDDAAAEKPLFGAAPASTAGKLAFGATEASSTPALFGASAPAFSFGASSMACGASSAATASAPAAATPAPFSFGASGGTSMPAFGSSTAGAASAPAAFGTTTASSTPAFGGFGATSSAFGSAPAGGGFSFGSSAPASAPAFSFGGAASGPAFGGGASAPAFGTSGSAPAFGGSASAPSFGAAAGTSAFGTAGSTPSFGAMASTPAFGAAASAPAFGAAASSAAFGAAASIPAFGGVGSGPTFGAASSGPTFGAAGSAPNFGAASSGPNFGAASSGPSFGAANSGPNFGAPASVPSFNFNSSAAPFAGFGSAAANGSQGQAAGPASSGFGGFGMGQQSAAPFGSQAGSAPVFGAQSAGTGGFTMGGGTSQQGDASGIARRKVKVLKGRTARK